MPDEKTLEKMALFFDVGITRAPDSTITHTLSTTLIGADGKVIRFYPGNEWTVEPGADRHEARRRRRLTHRAIGAGSSRA